MHFKNFKPSEPQLKGARFLVSKERGAVLYSTGSGKTLIQILTLFRLVKDGKIGKALIVGTKNSLIEIEKDFHTWTDVQPVILRSFGDWEKWFMGDQKFALTQYNWVPVLVTGDGTDMTVDGDGGALDEDRLVWLFKKFKQHRIGVTFDEFHTIKNPKSGPGRVFRLLRPAMARVYGATATGFLKDIFDLYYLVSFLDPSVLGSYETFCANYVIRKRVTMRRRYIWKVQKYVNLDSLFKVLQDVLVTHFPVSDVHFVKREAILQDKAEYLAAAKGFLKTEAVMRANRYKGLGSYDEDLLNADNGKQHSIRLVDLQYVVNRTKEKQEAFLSEVRHRLDRGTLVFCSFYETLEVLKALLEAQDIPYKEIHGQKSNEERISAKDWFIKNPANKVLLITRAGGQSLNLQGTPNIIFYDIPFGPGYFVQTMGRVVREFSAFKEFFISFICVKGTIDDYKFELISANREFFMSVFKSSIFPESVNLPSFSSNIIDRLKRELLWKEGKSRFI